LAVIAASPVPRLPPANRGVSLSAAQSSRPNATLSSVSPEREITPGLSVIGQNVSRLTRG
jgi:hypothetical protein